MNIELRQFKEMKFGQQWQIANAVSAETKSQFGAEQKIVPVTPISILQRELGVVALQENDLLGYVGATYLNKQYAQIGTLLVSELYQGSGIGTKLVASITEKLTQKDVRLFAFCNPISINSFENAGSTSALDGDIPAPAKSRFNNHAMVFPVFSPESRNEIELVGAGVLGQ